MPKIRAFEQYSDAYDEWFAKNRDLYAAEVKAVRSLMPPGHALGLEVGIGSGKFAAPLGVQIGVDPSKEMAEKAQSLGIQVIIGAAEHLPLPGSVFDFVLMVTTICFVDDIDRSFRESYRVLRDEGSLIAAFIDKESERGRKYSARKDKSRFYKEARFFSSQEVFNHMGRAGFRDFETRQTLLPGQSPFRIEKGFGKGGFVVIKGKKRRRRGSWARRDGTAALRGTGQDQSIHHH